MCSSCEELNTISGTFKFKNEGGHGFQFVLSPLPESSILLCNLPDSRGLDTGHLAQCSQCSQDLCPKGPHDKQCHLKSIQINPFVNEKIAIKIAIFKTLQLSKNGIFQFMVSFHIRSETCFAHSSFQRDFCLITKIIWELTRS